MAIGTYSELQTAIAYRCGNRSDAAFLAATPEAISLCEAEMQRRLQTTDMEATAPLTATVNSASITLPTGFARARRIRLLYGGVYTDLEIFALGGTKQSWGSGPPVQVAIQGSSLILSSPADQAYSIILDYWTKFTPLSTGAPTNWILTDHPDAYLYGSMAHAFYGQGAVDRGDSFISKFVAIIDDINEESADKESVDAHLRTEIGWMNRRPFNIRTG